MNEKKNSQKSRGSNGRFCASLPPLPRPRWRSAHVHATARRSASLQPQSLASMCCVAARWAAAAASSGSRAAATAAVGKRISWPWTCYKGPCDRRGDKSPAGGTACRNVRHRVLAAPPFPGWVRRRLSTWRTPLTHRDTAREIAEAHQPAAEAL